MVNIEELLSEHQTAILQKIAELEQELRDTAVSLMTDIRNASSGLERPRHSSGGSTAGRTPRKVSGGSGTVKVSGGSGTEAEEKKNGRKHRIAFEALKLVQVTGGMALGHSTMVKFRAASAIYTREVTQFATTYRTDIAEDDNLSAEVATWTQFPNFVLELEKANTRLTTQLAEANAQLESFQVEGRLRPKWTFRGDSSSCGGVIVVFRGGVKILG